MQESLRQHGDLFQLHFLPPYSPDHNAIERVWREVHANVTRNHCCKTIEDLMRRVIWHLRREARRLKQSAPKTGEQSVTLESLPDNKMNCSESWTDT